MPETISLFRVSHQRVGTQAVGSSLTDSQANEQGAALEVEQPDIDWRPYGMLELQAT